MLPTRNPNYARITSCSLKVIHGEAMAGVWRVSGETPVSILLNRLAPGGRASSRAQTLLKR